MPARDMRDLRAVPELEGWWTFTEAAEFLGVSRQRFYQLAAAVDQAGEPLLQTVRRLGARPTFIIRAAEVCAFKEGRAEASQPAAVPALRVVGGLGVTEADLRAAIAVLAPVQHTRGSFRKAMAKAANPLAASDYMSTARAYKAAHPEARGLNTKQALLAAYQHQLEDAERLSAAV